MKIQDLISELEETVDEISIEELSELCQQNTNLCIIDIRDKEEVLVSGKIVGAKAISKGVLECQIEGACPDDEVEIILYCRSGTRSMIAADSLKRMGYRHVKSLTGGFMAWKMNQLPTESL